MMDRRRPGEGDNGLILVLLLIVLLIVLRCANRPLSSRHAA